MPSIVPGYEYDIFISYRQKDNRSDKWVTNFVKALREELDAAFKEEISIYFDENPHDGLSETHNVSKSLEGKLKCLVFIPIVSQTYCDPNSFAWQHEFRAFIALSREDRYGLDIRLRNGNVASRILPVKIHDLDAEDKEVLETEFGGVLRAVEFIFRSPGVNRPLTSRDDDAKEITHALFYRDQINKLANAIKELLQVLKHQATNPEPTRSTDSKKSDPQLEIGKTEREKPTVAARVSALGDAPLEVKDKKILTRKTLSMVILLVVLGTIAYNVIELRKRWAADSLIGKIEKIGQVIGGLSSIERGAKGWEAYRMVVQIDLPGGQPNLVKNWVPISRTFKITTDPPGAKVYVKPYSAPEEPWTLIGQTPIDSTRLPVGTFRIKIEKDGHATQEDAIADRGTYDLSGIDLHYSLIEPAQLPEGMVLAAGDTAQWWYRAQAKYGDFFIDRFEVTNRAYKQFVDAGGYTEKKFWKYPFVKDGKSLLWEDAMPLLTDKTGRSGPSGWVAGSFPNEEGDFPVGGVSWYEAAAYAEFVGKELPSIYHFRALSMPEANAEILTLSNINGKGSKPVGTTLGMTRFGTYDLAGNVREWVFNEVETTGNRIIPGGGWSDDRYVYGSDFDSFPFDRAGINGFRCMKQRDDYPVSANLFSPVINFVFDMSKRKPVTDAQYDLMARMYDYEPKPVESRIMSRKVEADWVTEKILFPAAYGKDSVIVYLFLPKNATPPYQTVVYYPGGGTFVPVNSEKHIDWSRLDGLDFVVRTGRAVMFPVYYGTMERYDPLNAEGPDFLNPHRGLTLDRDKEVKIGKDFRRSVDYLSTRGDIDMNKLGYLGFSQGGGEGAIMLAIEKRIKTAVLVVCGLTTRIEKLPEADRASYLPRVSQPVLMLNSLYDWNYPYDISQKPFFDLLGTPAEHKKLILYNESGHQIPRDAVVKEALNWFDQYLGDVVRPSVTAARN